MRRRIQQLARWVTRWSSRLGSGRDRVSKGASRRHGVEGLERRDVLSNISVTPFQSVPSRIETAGQPVSVEFRLNPQTVRGLDTPTMLIGLNARPATGSTVDPTVTKVVGPRAVKPPMANSNGRPFIVRLNVPQAGEDVYTAQVSDAANRTGDIVLDAFLPGDVDGNLKVDKADRDRLLAAYGRREGQPGYDAAADINSDGTVGCRDRFYLIRNFGADATLATAPPAPIPTPTLTVPVVEVPVATPVRATVAPVVTLTPATVSVAPTAVATPVQATVAPVTPAVATPTVATQAANVVWIPVVTTPGGVGGGANPVGVATGAAPVGAFYATAPVGTPPVALTIPSPTYVTIPTGQAPTATTYYTVPAGTAPAIAPVQTGTAVPAGPLYYYSAPSSTPQGVSIVPGGQPAYVLSPSPR